MREDRITLVFLGFLGKNKSFLAVTNGEVNKAARCETIPLPPLLHLKTVSVVLKGCSFITMAGCARGPGVFVLTKKRLTHDKRAAQDTGNIYLMLTYLRSPGSHF